MPITFDKYICPILPNHTIGKYERGNSLPSIEVMVKLAKAFEVSVDFMLGEGLNASYDNEMIKRLDELEHLPSDEKQRIFYFMDLIIQDYKSKAAYALDLGIFIGHKPFLWNDQYGSRGYCSWLSIFVKVLRC